MTLFARLGTLRRFITPLGVALSLLACRASSTPESRLAAALVPGAQLGDSLASVLPTLGAITVVPCADSDNGRFEAEFADTSSPFKTVGFYALDCRHDGEARARVRGLFLRAAVGRSARMEAIVEDAATRIYGKPASTGCLPDAPAGHRKVLYWRSLSGGASLLLPIDSAREINYHDVAILSLTLDISGDPLSGASGDC